MSSKSTALIFVRNLPRHIVRLPRNAIIALIELYQHTLSPDHGPLRHLHTFGYCRHSPTCSQYAKEQIRARGAVIGCFLGLRRVVTCHPWHEPDEERMRELTNRVLHSKAGDAYTTDKD